MEAGVLPGLLAAIRAIGDGPPDGDEARPVDGEAEGLAVETEEPHFDRVCSGDFLFALVSTCF